MSFDGFFQKTLDKILKFCGATRLFEVDVFFTHENGGAYVIILSPVSCGLYPLAGTDDFFSSATQEAAENPALLFPHGSVERR